MFFRNYPILRLLIPFVLGVGVAYWTPLGLSRPVILSLMGVCWLVAVVLQHRKTLTTTLLSGIFLQILFMLAGFCLTCIRFRNDNMVSFRKTFEEKQTFVAKIIDHPVPKAKSFKVLAIIVQSTDGQAINQNALLYFAKDSLHPPDYGDVVIIRSKISEIENYKDPSAFDYKKYTQRKGIFFTGYVPKNRWQQVGHFKVNPIRDKAYRIQHYFSRIFADAGMSGDEYSIIICRIYGNLLRWG